MKIFAVSDQVVDHLYTSAVRQTYPDVRMIIGCGDLPYSYLEFLVTVFNVPMFYVPGNHDPAYGMAANARAQGGTNLDGTITFCKGFLLAGLGGSVRYRLGSPNQYSQFGMYRRVFRMLPAFFWSRIRHRRPIDILIAHSPPAGIHDDEDPPHRGLHALNFLLKVAHPRYMLHGHTIFYRQNLRSHITRYLQTDVVNIYPFRILEIE